MEQQKALDIDAGLAEEIRGLEDEGDFAGTARRLFRLGVDAERENRRVSQTKGADRPFTE
jgi:hypothetical protein